MKITGLACCLPAFALTVVACAPGPEATPLGRSCTQDADCNDHLFCNGVETCAGLTGKKSCTASAPPCAGLCSENKRFCAPPAGGCNESNPDQDGDGHIGTQCLGDDCDDHDATRFPGNPEVCDAIGHDEDCNDSTLGPDVDGDGEVSTRCCNLVRGALHCGADCDDTTRSRYSSAIEVCNGVDDDCDGVADNGVMVASYSDADGDGHGAGASVQKCAGAPGFSILGNDCDDAIPAIAPGAMRCILTTPQILNDLETCTSAGTFLKATCAGAEQCRVQPNGTGVCL